MSWIHTEILLLQEKREESLKKFPGVDIDAIHFKRGAVSERLKKEAKRHARFPDAGVELTNKKKRA